MTLAAAIEKVRRLSRTNSSGGSNTLIMDRINEAMKEFAKAVFGLTKEGYIAITPLFDLQTTFAIRLTIDGGYNELAATDIVICATAANDQTGSQVATALQVAIRAAVVAGGHGGAGPLGLTVSWSTTAWTFTIDAQDSTSITVDNPTTIIYTSALELLGLGAETSTGTSVTGSIPTECTIESALPTDFLELKTPPEWDGDQLAPGRFEDFLSPGTCGTPTRYYIRNKNIMLYPPPHEQKILHLYYKYLPTSFTTPHGYQECGLSGKRLSTLTGLTAATTYYYKVNIDGGGVTEYSILTVAGYLNYEEIIDLMNAQSIGATFSLEDGDLRCTSDLLGAASSIALSAGTTGTNLFATLTGWSAFDTAVATQGGDELPIDDEWCDAIVYKAASQIAEENFEATRSDRYFAQFQRIKQQFIIHRANQNTAMLDGPAPQISPEVDLGT
jgi:hypothetical protein